MARIDVLQQRRLAVRNLAGVAIAEIPAGLPELQRLRLQISIARAAILVLEQTVTALHERELPRSLRIPDPNASQVHIESRGLTEMALRMIAKVKETIG